MEKSAKHLFSWPISASNEEVPTIAARISTGERLATVRKELGITVEEVSETLKITVEGITAIENNDFHELPGKTYATGYVRAYAKHLKLNADELIENDPDLGMVPFSQMPPYVLQSSMQSRSTREPINYRSVFIRSTIALLIIMILAAGVATWMQRDTLMQQWQGETEESGEIIIPEQPRQPTEPSFPPATGSNTSLPIS